MAIPPASVATLLQSYTPSSAAEEDFAHLMNAALAEHQAQAFLRSHVEPGHFTASSFVLSPERDALLLLWHPKLHKWLQPGGHLEESDETLLAAARREVAEEVGLVDLPLAIPGIFDIDIHEIPARGPEPRHLHLDVRFLFVAPTRDFVLGDDIKQAQWAPLTELGNLTTDASVLRAAQKLNGA